MTTEERLQNLERELARAKRRNRRLLVFALVAAGAGVVATAWIGTPGKVLAESGAKAPNVIRASGFILVDADGKFRAALGVDKDGEGLVLTDENGKVRAVLGLSKDGPSLVLSDENGKVRAGLGAFKHGPGLSLYDENGKVIWSAGGAASPGQATGPVEAAPPAPQWRPCPRCNGSGNGSSPCYQCKGRGRTPGSLSVCSSCNGRGFEPCERCRGKGMVKN